MALIWIYVKCQQWAYFGQLNWKGNFMAKWYWLCCLCFERGTRIMFFGSASQHQRHKNLKLKLLFTRKMFPDEARGFTFRDT